MNKEKLTLEELEELIHDYENEENYESMVCRAINICDIPTEDLETNEISCLLDTIKGLLYYYGMLSKDSVLEEYRFEALDDLTFPESAEMIDSIIKKITSIMGDYGLIA